MVVADQPVHDQAGAEQQAGGAAQTGEETRRRPQHDVVGNAHHQSAEHRQQQADAIEPVLEHQIADQRGGDGAGQVAGVVAGRQPAAGGHAEAGLLLHQRQHRRVGKTGDAEDQQQAEDAGAQDFQALPLVGGCCLRHGGLPRGWSGKSPICTTPALQPRPALDSQAYPLETQASSRSPGTTKIFVARMERSVIREAQCALAPDFGFACIRATTLARGWIARSS
jgi:hypothetical protein